MRLLVAAGGTGGGVYPALAVVGAFVASSEHADVLWVGSEGGMEASLVERAGIPYAAIPAAGLHGVGVSSLPANVLRLARGIPAARQIMRRFKPNVQFFTGGYVGVPVAYAGRHHSQAMYVPDIQPAMALRLISRWVDAIAVTNEESLNHYRRSQSVVLTGYPTRAGLTPLPKDEARRRLGLQTDVPTILVFGGSRGARSINHSLWRCFVELLSEMQVIHIIGALDYPALAEQTGALPPDFAARYRPFEYVHDEMAQVFSAADLVVSRAGAAVLGEYPLFGLPAILVPYPHAWRYQQQNAQYLEERGAARLINDEDLDSQLLPAIRSVMSDPADRERMSEAMRALHRPRAADDIASILIKIAGNEEDTDG